MFKLQEVVNSTEKVVGGKAFRLAQMQLLGLRVKEALVLDTREILEILANHKITSKLLNTICENLDLNGGIAVRSSAVGEDGLFSWAGQFISKLFIEKEELQTAILQCAEASNGETVKAYAKSHGIKSGNLALILQEMVKAEKAGVLFTRHPVTLDDHVMVIEVITGVAEELVSGHIEPSRYYVDAIDGHVLSKEGATYPSLSLEQISELVLVGRQLRELFGRDQDIEWAIEKDTGFLYLNQSRNITTDIISPIKEVTESIANELNDEKKRLADLGCQLLPDILSDQNISEILTPHPTQMSFGLFSYCFAHGQGAIRTARNEMGYNIGEELNAGFFRLVAGQPRCSIIHDALTYRIQGIPLEDYAELVNYYLTCIKKNPSLGNYPEVQLYNQNPSLDFLVRIFGEEKANQYDLAYKNFFTGIRNLEDTLYKDCQIVLIEWTRILTSSLNSPTTNLAELSKRYRLVCDLLRTRACPLFVKVARLGFFSFARLRNLLQELFEKDGESYLNTLIGGISPENNPNLQFSLDLRSFKQGLISLDTILAHYGHLASHELEISTPRYHDQPQLIGEISEKLELSETESYINAQSKSEKLLQSLTAIAQNRGTELSREVKIARTYLPLREVVKFHFLKGYALLRQIAVQMENQLKWSKGLIFYLNPEEIFKICENKSGMKNLATKRHNQSKKENKIEVPPVLFTDQLDEIGKYISSTSNILLGIGVTNAVAEGEAIVITSLSEKEAISRLSPGKILVTITTDPAWSPVLAILGSEGGLITEVGGLLAHGAIYAREMNIGAVLNVPHATQIIKTGMKVRVNGPKGIVEILD